MANLPHPVDLHVGSRLRLRRKMAGASQEELAKALGLTFQQLQKYEKGANRISASKLHRLAVVLRTPVAWFFEGLETHNDGGGAVEPRLAQMQAFLTSREGVELALAFPRLPPRQRRQILALIASLSDFDLAQTT